MTSSRFICYKCDYDPHSEDSIEFFKIVQNKLHFAAHGYTAAEVIYERVDLEKPFMGLTSFSGEVLALKEISIAKNYLKEKELKILKLQKDDWIGVRTN